MTKQTNFYIFFVKLGWFASKDFKNCNKRFESHLFFLRFYALLNYFYAPPNRQQPSYGGSTRNMGKFFKHFTKVSIIRIWL